MRLLMLVLAAGAAGCATIDDGSVPASPTAAEIVAARQAAMWAIRQRYPSLSLELIGTTLGGRHYSTVMHGLAAAEQRAQRDSKYREQLQQLILSVNDRVVGHVVSLRRA